MTAARAEAVGRVVRRHQNSGEAVAHVAVSLSAWRVCVSSSVIESVRHHALISIMVVKIGRASRRRAGVALTAARGGVAEGAKYVAKAREP